MAVSMSSVISFKPQYASYQQVRSTNTRTLLLKIPAVICPSVAVRLTGLKSGNISRFQLSVADGDQVATKTNENDAKTLEQSSSDDVTSDNRAIVNSLATNDNVKPIDEAGLTAQDSEGSLSSTNPNQDTPLVKSNSTIKRAPLTARERLRAARVLGRYTEPKSSKPELGSRLLEALQETDKGKKRPGLPEAPKNLFDDSKRGLPKQGWTINIIPGGMDVFLIVFSFVFISTVMFATTYIVWKVGAIHFNEY